MSTSQRFQGSGSKNKPQSLNQLPGFGFDSSQHRQGYLPHELLGLVVQVRLEAQLGEMRLEREQVHVDIG